MKTVMLAAGVGRRLYGDDDTQPPKSLLEFEGRSLLRRHVETLVACGVEGLVLVVGYRHEAVASEAEAHAPAGFIQTVFNPDFRDGPVVSLHMAASTMRSGDDILFMDADVLYHPALIERLLSNPAEACFLFDQEIEGGNEPVRLCIRDGVPVEFGKGVEGTFDRVGEWPGFLRMSARIANRVADAIAGHVAAGQRELAYEPAMREVLLDEPKGVFGYEDISGLPWIEIDFPGDLQRAENSILPAIHTLRGTADHTG